MPEPSDGPLPTVKKWVQKKTDTNCLSADPKDCLVWCLVEVPLNSKADVRAANENTYCPAKFEKAYNEVDCEKEISVSRTLSAGKKLKLLDLTSDKEYLIESWEKISCED